MRIGQLAQLVGVETQTIRFYEQQGLLPPPDRQDNGYRVYTEKHGEGLAFIRRCRILGLSLAEIHELQSYQDDPHQPCTAVNALLDDHISHVRSQIPDSPVPRWTDVGISTARIVLGDPMETFEPLG